MPTIWNLQPAEIGEELANCFPSQFAGLKYGKPAPPDAYVRTGGTKINWGKGGAPASASRSTQFRQEMFDDFCRIAALLTNRDRCLLHLKALDLEMCHELAYQLSLHRKLKKDATWEEAVEEAKAHGKNWQPPDIRLKKTDFSSNFHKNFPPSVLQRYSDAATSGLTTESASTLTLQELVAIEQLLPILATLAGSDVPKFYGVLQRVLLKKENKHGFNGSDGAKLPPELAAHAVPGQVPTLTGFFHPESFLKLLVGQGIHFKDPGAGNNHGEFTHRIQWWVVVSEYECKGPYATKARPVDRMRHCALLTSHAWRNAKTGVGVPKNTSQGPPQVKGASPAELKFVEKGMWDFCFDCVQAFDETNPGPVDTTYRSPEAFLKALTGPLASDLPALSNFLKVRNHKRAFFATRGLQAAHQERILKTLQAHGVNTADLPGKLEFLADGKAVWR